MRIALVRGPYLRPSGVVPWELLAKRDGFEIVAFESDPPRFDTSSLDLPVRQLPWPDGKLTLFGHDNAVSKGLRRLRCPSGWLRGVTNLVSEFDVIHTSENFNLFSYQAARATRGTDTQFAFAAGENIPYPPFQRNPLLWRMKRIVNDLADGITTTTPIAKRALIHELVDHEKISVVPNCIDTDRFAPRTATTTGLPFPDSIKSTTNVLFVHGLREQKGVPNLLDAWRRLDINHEETRLLLLGENDLGPEKTAEVENTPSIHWVKHIPYSKMPTLYNCCEITVLPSVTMPNNEEQFGMGVLESMACGLATVVTDVGGLPYVTEAGKTSLVVPERDPSELTSALRRLLTDTDLRRRLGKNGRERAVTEFSKPTVTDRLQAFYEELDS